MTHRVAWRIGHRDDLGRRSDSQPLVVTDDARYEPAQLRLVADENELEVAVPVQGRGSRANGNLGSEVAAHGIE